MINLVIMISGRGSNMKAILESIRKGEIDGIDNILVISNKPDALGLVIAEREYGVKTTTVLSNKNDESFESRLNNELKKYNIYPHNGLICLAGFMKILSPSFVELYKHRIMNVHPSLLPSFKGLHAQKQALLAGVKISGCTVHFVDNGVDSGPIILQYPVPVYYNDDELSLSERILVKEHETYVRAIKLFALKQISVVKNRVVQTQVI
ncbi:MAG: phosphoribosylglycinamide formyltransferase [Candidatus Nitrosocosmicus sp.]|nr:phosphoribosylglycinamide formyltransferase [Candidatus Nitrosocosmicus sp.]